MAKKNEIANTELVIVNSAQVQQMIHVVRGERVILDRDLAQLYGVETKNLKRQVKRNASRFPSDFMIELSREEYNSLRCQNGTIDNGRGEHSKYLPYAFTESGVAMLSSVLTSQMATINESLAELAVKVDSLTQKKQETLPEVGFAATAARYEEEVKKKANK